MIDPALPRTFRPRWGRPICYVAAAAILAVCIVGAVTLPTGWSAVDRVAIVIVGAAAAFLLHRLADVRIVCDEGGVSVMNIGRGRRLEWAEIIAVRLEDAAPWLVLDLSDGTALPAMGVQGSDGTYAREQAHDLTQLVVKRSAPE